MLSQEQIIKKIQTEQAFLHNTNKITLEQTHISWVILTGNYAYKIKKAVNLGFVDFSDLDKRKHYCALEIELNKKTAPNLYKQLMAIIQINGQLKVIPINQLKDIQSDNKIQILEYAIQMQQFDQNNLLSKLAINNKITEDIIQNLAQSCAKYHQLTDIAASNSEFGTFEQVKAPMLDNFTTLYNLPVATAFNATLKSIEKWTNFKLDLLKPIIEQRKLHNKIKACHGDLHLGNVVLIDNKPVIFDCIEFNESFRWLDPVNDIAFFAMDLEHKHQTKLANLYINTYLEYTNDYEGIILLNLYKTYRALVRAKVSALGLSQVSQDDPAYAKLSSDLNSFINLAFQYTKAKTPKLIITFGPSCSGKSTYTKQLMQITQAIRLRSDVIRKHYMQLDPFKPTEDNLKSEVYSTQVTKKLYQTLGKLAEQLLAANYSVIIDAANLYQWQRELFINLAQQLKLPIQILNFVIGKEELLKRAHDRQLASTTKSEPSDAGAEIIGQQLTKLEDLSVDELKISKKISADSN